MSAVTEENEHERENDKETALPPLDWSYVYELYRTPTVNVPQGRTINISDNMLSKVGWKLGTLVFDDALR